MALVLFSDTLQDILPAGQAYQPAYGGESAGLDLYCTATISVPDVLHQRAALISTGIHVKLEANEVGLIFERGSIIKTRLIKKAGVIDPGYTGEIFVQCDTLGNATIEIARGTKLPFQLIILPFITPNVQYTPDIAAALAELATTSSRKIGALGSSD